MIEGSFSQKATKETKGKATKGDKKEAETAAEGKVFRFL